MLIEQISIVSFGKLKNTELDFRCGLNVIEGKNESGKSTVAAFIRYMLYGFSGKSDATGISDKRRYISWETSTAQGSMTVSSEDGKRYRIDRKTILLSTQSGKEQYRETSSITDLSDNSPVFPKQKAGEALFNLPEELFDRIAFVNQISDSSVDGVAISEAIENMLFSGDEKVGVQRALDKIDSARRALLHKNEKGGEIYELSVKISELKRSLEAAVSENEQIFLQESQLNKTTEELSRTSNEIERLSSAIDIYKKIQISEGFQKLHSLEAKKDVLQKEKDSLTERNTINGFCPDSSFVSELTVANKRIEDADASIENAKKAEAECKKKTELPKEYTEPFEIADKNGGISALYEQELALRKSKKNLLCLFFISLIAAFSLIAARIIPLAELDALLIGGAVILLLSLILLILYVSKHRKCNALYMLFKSKSRNKFISLLTSLSEKEKEIQGNMPALALAQKNISDLKSARNSRASELCELLARKGKAMPQDPEERNELLKEISSEIHLFRTEEARLGMEILKLETSINELSSHLSEFDESELNEFLTPERRKTVLGIDINDVNKTLLFCQEKQKALALKEKDLRSRYTVLKAKADSPSQIKERIDEYEDRLSKLKAQYNAYVLASEAINGASDRLRQGLSPHLSAYACRATEKITDGKYSQIGVSPSFALSYTYDNATRPPEALSHGTRSAIYLSMRLALIDLLCHEKIPLCLDESLVFQDRDRAEQILLLLEDLSKDKLQTFLFTCHSREAELLTGREANIIKL